jgi:hypothetical protein
VRGGCSARAARIAQDCPREAGEGRAPAGYGRGSGARTEAVVEEGVQKVSTIPALRTQQEDEF